LREALKYPAHKSWGRPNSHHRDLPRLPSAAVASEGDHVLRVERRQPTESGWDAFAAASGTHSQRNRFCWCEIPSTLPEMAMPQAACPNVRLAKAYLCRIYPSQLLKLLAPPSHRFGQRWGLEGIANIVQLETIHLIATDNFIEQAE